MKPRNDLILAYCIACVLAISAGLAYGLSGLTRTYGMTWAELEALTCDPKFAHRRIKQINFVSAAWPDTAYPQLEVEFKSSILRAVVTQPRLKQVEWLLQKSEQLEIDFCEIELIPTAMYNAKITVDLIKNGHRTKDYRSPPSFIVNGASPPDYVEHFQRINPDPVKSPPPNMSETNSSGINPDGTIKNWDIRRYYIQAFPGPWMKKQAEHNSRFRADDSTEVPKEDSEHSK